MNFKKTIKRLLQTDDAPDDPQAEAERCLARIAWVSRTAAALRRAQARMDRRCDAAVDKLDEQEFSRLFDAEQARVDAFLNPLRAAADHDHWPRDLYWGGI